MSSVERTQLDHAEAGLSTDDMTGGDTSRAPLSADSTACERANALRYRAPSAGHVESHFLKANSPDGQRALWVKHTLLVPTRGDAEPVAELWAIAFDQRGRRKLAQKVSYPLSAARLSDAPFSFVLPDAELRQGRAHGALGLGDARLSWQLSFASEQAPFLPFRYPRMYTGAFPRSKSLTPFPDTRAHGTFTAFGQHWDLAGWRAAQGHNWGKSHAHAYGWLHCNALSLEPGALPLEDTWVEVLSGRVRLGPLVTPFLSVAGLRHQGRLFRFDAARAIVSRKIAIDTRSFRFELAQGGATLAGEFRADPEQFAGLRYEDPDGRALACLNSKLASGRLTLSYEGRSSTLYTDQAALELGTRSPDHGVAMLA
jgi:hypothetical protein